LQPDLLVTHRFGFSEMDRAFETVDRGDAVKALIVFD
jgi:Zn-dependent alcohol dehydrogenase